MDKIYRQYTEEQLMDSDNYGKHVSAMTGEALHSKSDIAAELAIRDDENYELKAKIAEQAAYIENLRIAWDAVKKYDWDEPLDEAMEMTPAQCLAEVRAKSYEHGFLDGYYQPEALIDPQAEAAASSENYANQLRQKASK